MGDERVYWKLNLQPNAVGRNPVWTSVAVALLGTLLSASGPAPAPESASLRGRVEIRHPLPAVRVQPAEHPGREVLDARNQAVVYFDEAPVPDATPPPLHVMMHQRDERFVPHLLAVPVGSTVDFPNDDTTYHNVFSLSKTKRFDLGRYAVGRSKAVTFSQPGIVRVFCDIHSHMNAFILVFEHRYFAVTDEAGRYRIDGVPPGTYTVTAWYEGTAKVSKRVTIPASGLVDLDFQLD